MLKGRCPTHSKAPKRMIFQVGAPLFSSDG